MTPADERQRGATQIVATRTAAGAIVTAAGTVALLACAAFYADVRQVAAVILGALYLWAACGRLAWQRRARAAAMSPGRETALGGADRETLGRIVRDIRVDTVLALVPNPKPSWLTRWPELADPFQREVDMRIGEEIAALSSPERAVRVMCQVVGLHAGQLPAFPTADIPEGLAGELWGRIEEQVSRELRPAMISGDLVKIAGAIPGAVGTLIDAALCYGLPFDALFREVMRSNMTKTSQPGQPELIEGEHYEPPRIAEILLEAVTGPAVHPGAATGMPGALPW